MDFFEQSGRLPISLASTQVSHVHALRSPFTEAEDKRAAQRYQLTNMALQAVWKNLLREYTGRLRREHPTQTGVRVIACTDTPRPALLLRWGSVCICRLSMLSRAEPSARHFESAGGYAISAPARSESIVPASGNTFEIAVFTNSTGPSAATAFLPSGTPKTAAADS